MTPKSPIINDTVAKLTAQTRFNEWNNQRRGDKAEGAKSRLGQSGNECCQVEKHAEARCSAVMHKTISVIKLSMGRN